MSPPDRYFAATILGGRLLVRGIPQWGPWNSARLDYRLERDIDIWLNEAHGDRKVRTEDDLVALLAGAAGPTPVRLVWIHESLEATARRVWETRTKIDLPPR